MKTTSTLIAVGVVWALIGCRGTPSSTSDGARLSQNASGPATAQDHPDPNARPIVATPEGAIRGTVERGAYVFRGVPYAMPPVGPLRWRAPRPPASRAETLDAEYFGLSCIQPPGLSAANGGDAGKSGEDCLTLNIWTQKIDRSARLPVFVWIHGGAFIFGTGSLDAYNGTSLASRGAVVVTLNYRLGQLGFFAHPALERESPGGPVNFGLLDVIQALTWIQGNIAAFGGDATNVTIAGQSAGAKTVLALFASPLARGLFHKGIAQSSYAIPDATRLQALTLGIAVARASGLNGAAATADQLRGLRGDQFATMIGRSLSVSPVPVRGDPVLPRSIQDTFADGQEARLPLVLGSVSDDSSVVQAFGFDFAQLVARLGAAHLPLRALYPDARDDDDLGRQSVRDAIFTMNARWAADRHSRLAPTWRYYFDYVAVGGRSQVNGAYHGGDVMFTLDSHEAMGSAVRFTEADRAFSRTVGDYWFGFARTGTPSSPSGPDWPEHKDSQDRTMVLSAVPSVEVNFMRTRLNLFIGSVSVLDRLFRR